MLLALFEQQLLLYALQAVKRRNMLFNRIDLPEHGLASSIIMI